MIDFNSETILSLPDATGILPRRRRGKRVAVQTLYRWILHGIRGNKLEAIRVGGGYCTSKEALQRFFERLTPPVAPTASASSAADQKRQVAIDRELDRRGIGAQR